DKYGLLAGMHNALAAQAAGGLCFLLVIYFICRHGLSHPSLGAYRTEETASSLALSPESVG
ncbi:MAG: hypothetical protein HYS33_04835, partial [Acidobacteria bacterium]|nr:hypothetical protein [Acidobacteriota bacterium]